MDRPHLGGEIALFLATSEAGSFADAGRRLGLTASAVAKGVGRLEQRLGVSLLHRTTRTMGLTREGQVYLEACRSARDILVGAQERLKAASQAPQGRVVVSLPPVVGEALLAPALFETLALWEQLELTLDLSSEARDLGRGEVDVAVRIGTLPDTTELVARRVGAQAVVLCAAPAYLGRRGMPRIREDLAGHDLIQSSKGWPVSGHDGARLVPEGRRHLVVDKPTLALRAAEVGQGIACVPRWMVVEPLRQGRLVEVLPEWAFDPLPVYVIWRRRAQPLPRERVVMDILIAECLRIFGDTPQV